MASIEDYLDNKADVISKSGPNVFIVCPGCGTRKAKCAIHVNRGVGNCFKAACPLHGGFSFPRLIMVLENVPYSVALGTAANYSDAVERDYKAKSFGTNRQYPKNALPIQELINLANYKGDSSYDFLLEKGVSYLADKRKLTYQQIEDYQLGIGYEDFSIDSKEVVRRGMIVAPIFFNGEIVSYYGRSIEYKGCMLGRQKHIHADPVEGYLSIGQTLFNADIAIPHARKVGYLVIVEDAWSAIKLKAIATLGSSISEDQFYIIANNYNGPVVICRDNDKGGRSAVERDIEVLCTRYEDIRVATPVGVDPDDNLNATEKRILSARPINLFERKLRRALSP